MLLSFSHTGPPNLTKKTVRNGGKPKVKQVRNGGKPKVKQA